MWLEQLWDCGGSIMHVVGRLDRTQWLLVFFGALVFGFVCTRGFGSRNNY